MDAMAGMNVTCALIPGQSNGKEADKVTSGKAVQ
jgi:hypothetical protein